MVWIEVIDTCIAVFWIEVRYRTAVFWIEVLGLGLRL